MEKQKFVDLWVIGIAVIGLLLIFSMYPKCVPEQLFIQQGYEIDGIIFTKDKNRNWGQSFYYTSEPIEVNDGSGNSSDYWQVCSWGSTGVVQYVKPVIVN